MNLKFDPKEILLIFGINIKRTREMQGLRISKLATSIGYDRGCLSSLERGEQNIEYITALNLARKLQISFPTLFSRNYYNDSKKIIYHFLIVSSKMIFFLFLLKIFRES